MSSAIALLSISASDATVVVTSISLVFCMLIALCLVVTAEGRLFDAAAARKKQRESQALPSAPAAPAPVPAPAPAAPAQREEEQGVPPQVVAAIAAAVYCLQGPQARVCSVRRLPQSAPGRRRGAWGDAGVAQNVRPF